MRNVFADAGYWIALVNPQDDLHQRAKEVSASLGPVRYTTSEMVLTEFLNSFANKGEHLRKVAVALLERLRENPNTTIVPQTSLCSETHFPCMLSGMTKPGVTRTVPPFR